MFRPNDIFLRPAKPNNKNWQISAFEESGFRAFGLNSEGERVPVTQIWTPTQDALAFIRALPETNPFSNIARQLNTAVDNGITGNFELEGTFRLKLNSGFSVRRWLPYDLVAGLFVPVCSASFSNPVFTDLTPASEIEVKELLTDDFFKIVSEIDPTLDFGAWHKHGLGDITALLEWIKNSPQNRPLLKNVMVNTRLGLTLPTGVKTNENQILSIPFGYDGSVGILFGGGITLSWHENVRGGIDAEFLQLFGNTKKRRVKKDIKETEFFFLEQVDTYREFGFTQRYQIYLEAFRVAKTFNIGIWYQYYQHGRDHLSPISNDVSATVANSATYLDEWSFHQVLFSFTCDPTNYFKNQRIVPQLMIYYKLPFAGKRVLLEPMFGCVLSLGF
jgi:hypothetical protein